MSKENKIQITNSPRRFQLNKPFLAVRWVLAGPYWSRNSKTLPELPHDAQGA